MGRRALPSAEDKALANAMKRSIGHYKKLRRHRLGLRSDASEDDCRRAEQRRRALRLPTNASEAQCVSLDPHIYFRFFFRSLWASVYMCSPHTYCCRNGRRLPKTTPKLQTSWQCRNMCAHVPALHIVFIFLRPSICLLAPARHKALAQGRNQCAIAMPRSPHPHQCARLLRTYLSIFWYLQRRRTLGLPMHATEAQCIAAEVFRHT